MRKEYISKADKKILNELIIKYNIKSVFEIGTWEGNTSLFFWNNINIGKVKTIDINNEMNIDYNHPVHMLNPKEFYGKYIKNTGVKFEFCSSMIYKPKKEEQYDMIFIDGNHEYEHIMNDTKLALKLKPKIIVWHDFDNGARYITEYINELIAEGKKIKICDESCIAYWEIEK